MGALRTRWVPGVGVGTVTSMGRVLAGGGGEPSAVREFEAGKSLVVVYRESDNGEFLVTAFWTRRVAVLTRRKRL
ncbi:MAG: hypothetical protein GX456_01835 [Verrucomicrobia bacterium]|nr:hypothetical protein [Verrucomicrobiota bacterium]